MNYVNKQANAINQSNVSLVWMGEKKLRLHISYKMKMK